MQYTVSSRGRPIGVTDLGFWCIGGPSRSGWFHPNTEGEALMPTIATALPAMQAYLSRDYRDEHGEPIVQRSLIGSTLFADLAEEFQRLAALELTLHREDGSLVPTELVGIQDTHAIPDVRSMLDMGDVPEPWCFGDDDGGPEPWELVQEEEDEEDEEDDAGMVDVLEEVSENLQRAKEMLAQLLEEHGIDWKDDDELAEEVAESRYQIHVLLSDVEAIP